jgi:hypothetical protein
MSGEKGESMNNLKQLVVSVFFVALSCTGMHAQTVGMRATVPFDFRAGDKLMPAGQYLIEEHGSWVALRVAGSGKEAVALLTNSALGPDSSHTARLDFSRYGSVYFLTAIWEPYSQNGRQVPTAAREKELAKNVGIPAQAVVVIAGKR